MSIASLASFLMAIVTTWLRLTLDYARLHAENGDVTQAGARTSTHIPFAFLVIIFIRMMDGATTLAQFVRASGLFLLGAAFTLVGSAMVLLLNGYSLGPVENNALTTLLLSPLVILSGYLIFRRSTKGGA